jgi:hypothetical protein
VRPLLAQALCQQKICAVEIALQVSLVLQIEKHYSWHDPSPKAVRVLVGSSFQQISLVDLRIG